MDTMAAPARTLLGLSAELQVLVAANLDKNDILAFRRTCSDLEKNSHDLFVEVFFHHRYHLFTIDSLQVLLEISLSRFAQHVKRLSFVACPVINDGAEKSIDEHYDHNALAAKLVKLSPGIDILVEIFKNFKQIGAAQDIRARSETWSKQFLEDLDANRERTIAGDLASSHRMALLRDSLDSSIAPHALMDGHIDAIFCTTIPALLEAEHVVKALNFGYEVYNGLAENSALADYRLDSAFWRNLTDIKLCLDTEILGDDGEEFGRHFWPALAKCSSLTTFALHSEGLCETEALGLSLQDTPVTSISLSMSRTNPTWLMNDLLNGLLPQLEVLELSDISLQEGNWNEICTSLSKAALRKVRLQSLEQYDHPEDVACFSYDEKNAHEAEGKDAVKEMLTILAKFGDCQLKPPHEITALSSHENE